QEKVAELSGIPPEDQVLLHAGTPLDDEAVLGQSPLPELATLELSTRLLGGNSGGQLISGVLISETNPPNSSISFLPPGKVHGSLARAGKVRGQTPKVSAE
ncbi:UBIM protein, partial [Alaudala cheleensis]|nr:UBIM protein [Alaudala cheleensis]